jgi:hypothetical protein
MFLVNLLELAARGCRRTELLRERSTAALGQHALTAASTITLAAPSVVGPTRSGLVGGVQHVVVQQIHYLVKLERCRKIPFLAELFVSLRPVELGVYESLLTERLNQELGHRSDLRPEL